MSRKYFGTDGIRGIAGKEPITADFAFKLGVAATETLKANGVLKPEIAIGRDTRHSGVMLSSAISGGIMSRGGNVTLLGIMPTPGVSFLTRELEADAGIVISASHNPFEDNGIKFFNSQGKKLSDAIEQEIEDRLEQSGATLDDVVGEDIGVTKRYSHENDDYYKYLLNLAPSLEDMKIGLDCANGAAYEIAPRLFRELGAHLDVIDAHPDGININLECGSTHPESLIRRVNALGLELGVSFDGDADRALLVDKKGRLVDGDHILAINALANNEKAIVATIMSNLGVENYLKQNGIKMIRSQVGDRYVHEELVKRKLNLGGEQSGHILFLDLSPTGDGILTALQTLKSIKKSGKSLEQWLDEIPLFPQVLLNQKVALELKAEIPNHPKVLSAVAKAENMLGKSGRINLRPSGTEPIIRVMVEGEDKTQINKIAQQVAEVVKSIS
ncbi:MAG TPA: phosphoglucosamine mutase [Trueperaceae bacterium]|nr:phosphoglucosamine mutase [Trueperaceae bacterium]